MYKGYDIEVEKDIIKLSKAGNLVCKARININNSFELQESNIPECETLLKELGFKKKE